MNNRFYMMCLRETVGNNASFHCHNGNGSVLISIALMFTRWKKPKKPGIVDEIWISLFALIAWMQWLCGTLIASTSLQKA